MKGPSASPAPTPKRPKRTPKKNAAQSPPSSPLPQPANDDDLESFEELCITDTPSTTPKANKKKAPAKKAKAKSTPAKKKAVPAPKGVTKTLVKKTTPGKAPAPRRSARKSA
ncbi:hypothetical protein AJ78_08041 [Emergomyces pasteurianus Ep9510]|uniref:Uncharacterized protein n=1 Tax=Emergomyces pasteurianus Ep9510 TaxID=1447872 RepID=A0A1J9P2Z1_9EURO|nr:hypothetical protein AJ78_08041 [Emergomyces pasteurianus Ep9510]